MAENLVVIYDACVLYPAPLRDLLIRLAHTNVFRAKWTKDIHLEWMTNLLEKRPDLNMENLERTRKLMDDSTRDCLVEGYENIIHSVTLPDPSDRHVLAAAIRANADTIITYNLKDFPKEALSLYDVEAQHPDDFLSGLIEMVPGIVCATIGQLRMGLRNPPKGTDEYLETLERQSLPQTVALLREYSLII